jgi:hypothetical protein
MADQPRQKFTCGLTGNLESYDEQNVINDNSSELVDTAWRVKPLK